MRVSQLVPGVEYATCDGRMITVFDPVSNMYAWMRTNDKRVLSIVDKTDPWGPCVGAKAPVETGVAVYVHEVLADGTRDPDEEPRGTLVRANDIKGTWSEYMALHAEKVRIEGESRAAQKASEAEATRMRMRLAEAFGSDYFRVYPREEWYVPGAEHTFKNRLEVPWYSFELGIRVERHDTIKFVEQMEAMGGKRKRRGK